MVAPIKIAILGVSVIVIYDALASIISLKTGFPYESFGYGSLLLYAVFGLLAFRDSGFLGSFFVGGLVGLAEATLGWYVSWIIGPGRSDVMFSEGEIALTVVAVTLTAACVGLIGGLLGWLVLRKSETT